MQAACRRYLKAARYLDHRISLAIQRRKRCLNGIFGSVGLLPTEPGLSNVVYTMLINPNIPIFPCLGNTSRRHRRRESPLHSVTHPTFFYNSFTDNVDMICYR